MNDWRVWGLGWREIGIGGLMGKVGEEKEWKVRSRFGNFRRIRFFEV